MSAPLTLSRLPPWRLARYAGDAWATQLADLAPPWWVALSTVYRAIQRAGILSVPSAQPSAGGSLAPTI